MSHEINLSVFFFLTLQTDERRAIPQSSLHTPGGKKYNLWIFFLLQLRLYDDDDDDDDDGAVQILFSRLCWKLNSVS